MIKFYLLSITAFSILPSSARASQALVGTYAFRGVSCTNVIDLGQEALKMNEDIRFTNNEALGTFNNGSYISKSKKFAFDRYGEDHCLTTLTRPYSVKENEVTFAARKKESQPFGKYGDKACRSVKVSEQEFKIKYKLVGDLLYLTGEGSEHTKVYCKNGPFHFVFQKRPNDQFTNVVRPKTNDKEKRILTDLSKKPKEYMMVGIYADFLLGEERIDEALIQAEKMRQLNPKSPYPKRMVDIAAAFKAETDLKKRDKEFKSALLSLSLDMAKTTLEPFEELAETVKQLEESLDKIKIDLPPKLREELAKTKEGREKLKKLDLANESLDRAKKEASSDSIAKNREVKMALYTKKYNLAERAKLQYDYSNRERSDTDTCVKKYAENKTEALDMLAKAYKNYPSSPYVLQEHLLMLIIADQVVEAENIFRKDSTKYPNQVGLEMIGEYLEKIKAILEKQARLKLASELNMEIRYLEMAVAQAKYNKKW